MTDHDGLDEQLMLRVRAGEMDALGRLFEHYKQPLFGFLARLLRDAALAEDVTLEVFLRVFERRDTYKPGCRFSTWLFTIAHHLATDHLRRNRRTETAPLPEDDALPDPAPVAGERGELAAVVRAAVQALPEDQRLVVVLREYQEFSYREIAEIVGATEETVRVRAYRARQALRKALAPYCEEISATAVTFAPAGAYTGQERVTEGS